jgi:subtilase-type serine protease
LATGAEGSASQSSHALDVAASAVAELQAQAAALTARMDELASSLEATSADVAATKATAQLAAADAATATATLEANKQRSGSSGSVGGTAPHLTAADVEAVVAAHFKAQDGLHLPGAVEARLLAAALAAAEEAGAARLMAAQSAWRAELDGLRRNAAAAEQQHHQNEEGAPAVLSAAQVALIAQAAASEVVAPLTARLDTEVVSLRGALAAAAADAVSRGVEWGGALAALKSQFDEQLAALGTAVKVGG